MNLAHGRLAYLVGIMTLSMWVGGGGLSLFRGQRSLASVGKHYSTAEEGIKCGPHESDLAASPHKLSGKPG